MHRDMSLCLRSQRVALVLGALLLAGIVGCAPVRTVDLLVVGGTAIDPGTGRVTPNATIVVDSGRVVTVVAGAVRGFASRDTLDAHGRFVMPALNDLHVHWVTGAFVGSDDVIELTLARSLYHGVVRVLHMGSGRGWPDEIRTIRTRLATGEWQGADPLMVGSLITVPGSHPTTTIYPPALQLAIAERVRTAPAGEPIDLSPLVAVTLVRSPAEMTHAVEQLADNDVDAIKLTIESGPVVFGEKHARMSRELVERAVAAAKPRGIPVLAHVTSADELEDALAAGVDAAAHTLEDPRGAAPDLPASMAKQGLFDMPTLVLFDALSRTSRMPERLQDPLLRATLSEAEATQIPPPQAFAAEQTALDGEARTARFAHVRAAHEAGVRMVLGTDTGNPYVFPGYSAHEELALLVEAGLPTMAALASATANAALLMRHEHDWGSLIAGQRADLLVLEADPVADIHNTRRIVAVVKGGVVVDRSRLHVQSPRSE